MTPVRRWCIVALGLALVAGTPLTLRALPAQDQDVSATTLLARVDASSGHPYSGYVESLGTLELPVADRFTDVGALFGERTRMRVWWQSPDEPGASTRCWRPGETDLFHAGAATRRRGTTRRTTSRTTATRRSGCRGPPTSCRRGRPATCCSRRQPRTSVAGWRRDAWPVATRSGCGLAPAAEQSSIDHVDVWVDPDTAIPLRVEVYAVGGPDGVVHLGVHDFSDRAAGRPTSPSFHAPPGADFDVRRRARHRRRRQPVRPDRAARGRWPAWPSRRPPTGRSASTARGVTQLIAIPLRDREAEPAARAAARSRRACGWSREGTVVTLARWACSLTGDGRRRRLADRRHRHRRHRSPPRPTTSSSAPVIARTTRADDPDTHGLTKRFGPITRRRRHRPRRARGRHLRLPRRQRLRQDHHRADAARPGARHQRRRSRCWAGRCRSAAREVLPQVGALVEAPAAYPHLSGRANLARPRRDRHGRRSPVAARPGRRRARPGRAWRASTSGRCAAYSLGMRQRLGLAARAAAAAAAAGARRADERPGPAGHPRDPGAAARPQRGRHDDLPVQPPARRGRADVHPGRRARPRPAGDPGRARRAAAADRAHLRPHAGRRPGAGLLDGQVEQHDATACWSACDDPAALNARLVAGPGCGSSSSRRSGTRLEDVVLAADRGRLDRFGVDAR